LKELEAERDAVVIPNEESIASFYKIRQQLKKLGEDMLVRYFTLYTLPLYNVRPDKSGHFPPTK
jgi:hypothetical protein